jgi:hypothetical protein
VAGCPTIFQKFCLSWYQYSQINEVTLKLSLFPLFSESPPPALSAWNKKNILPGPEPTLVESECVVRLNKIQLMIID